MAAATRRRPHKWQQPRRTPSRCAGRARAGRRRQPQAGVSGGAPHCSSNKLPFCCWAHHPAASLPFLPTALQVVVRIRPPLPRELHGFRAFENAVLVDPSAQVVTLSENLAALQNNGVEDGIVSPHAARARSLTRQCTATHDDWQGMAGQHP